MTGWAATNTLRKCEVQHWGDGLTTPDRRVISKEFDAALALVEAALDAAAEDLREDGYPVDDPDLDGRDDPQFKDELVRQWGAKKVALAAALRAVREGA